MPRRTFDRHLKRLAAFAHAPQRESLRTAGCTTLYSEDMHAGLLVEDRLRLVNPFG